MTQARFHPYCPQLPVLHLLSPTPTPNVQRIPETGMSGLFQPLVALIAREFQHCACSAQPRPFSFHFLSFSFPFLFLSLSNGPFRASI